MEKLYLQIAANILDTNNLEGDIGLINHYLAEALSEVALMCKQQGGELKSRQVIATFIYTWKCLNPKQKLYGD